MTCMAIPKRLSDRLLTQPLDRKRSATGHALHSPQYEREERGWGDDQHHSPPRPPGGCENSAPLVRASEASSTR